MQKIYSVVYNEGWGEAVEDFDNLKTAKEFYNRIKDGCEYAVLRDIEYSDDYRDEYINVIESTEV